MEMQVLEGLGVSEGIAIGRAVVVETGSAEVFRFPLPAEQVEEEVARFRSAAGRAREEVLGLGKRVEDELGEDLAAIFEAHALLLDDAHLLELVEARIRGEHVNAEWAVVESIAELRERFAAIRTEHLRERGEDLEDVGRHLIRALQGLSHHELSDIQGDVIVIADDLTPSDAVRLGRQGAVGFVTEAGGRTSHTAIIAISLDIPLVTGVAHVTRLAAHDDLVVVDGTTGVVVLHPTDSRLDESRRNRDSAALRAAALVETRDLPAVTRDGTPFELLANIDLVEELRDAVRYGAQGIGLYRSEFLYIERSPDLPDEEDHYRAYVELVEAMAPRPVTIRTYDLGGRKLAREVMETREENPVLGLRGIRLTLARPKMFRTQLRALLRAGCRGQLGILLPMVSTLDEVRTFRAFADGVARELEAEGADFCRDYELGVMIEVPSAALIADHLAREVDFFAIGTNDLIQYAMAVDRNNEHVTSLYQPLHPGLLRMIRGVVEHAERAGKAVSVCGEMAGDPVAAAMLIGLGVRRFSMSPRRIPVLKTTLRAVDAGRLAACAEECCGLATAGEVAERLRLAIAREAAPRPA